MRPAAQFASGVNVVEVYATVTERSGEPIGDLQAPDFRISEDGVPQQITAFAAGDVPLSILIALDRSFSMRGEPLRLAKRAAASFIRALRPEDEVTIVGVGSEIETLLAAQPAGAAAAFRWETIDAWGATLLYDAARASLDMIQSRRGRRALLLISDGADRGSETTATELQARARRSDVLMYPVAISKRRPPLFAELAATTGGRSLFLTDAAQLDAALASVARELRLQYLLGYVPARRAEREPAWHAIEVAVSRAGARVRARDGYYGS